MGVPLIMVFSFFGITTLRKLHSVTLTDVEIMPREEVVNRLKQGAAAATGSAAIIVLSSLRAVAAREGEVNVKGLAIVTAAVSLIAGIVWAFMPRAKDSLVETVEAVKEEVEPTIRSATNVALQQEIGNIPSGYTKYVPKYSSNTYSTSTSTYKRTSSITDDEFADEDFGGWRSVRSPDDFDEP